MSLYFTLKAELWKWWMYVYINIQSMKVQTTGDSQLHRRFFSSCAKSQQKEQLNWEARSWFPFCLSPHALTLNLDTRHSTEILYRYINKSRCIDTKLCKLVCALKNQNGPEAALHGTFFSKITMTINIWTKRTRQKRLCSSGGPPIFSTMSI